MQVTQMRRSTTVAHVTLMLLLAVTGAAGCTLPSEPLNPGNQPPLLTALPRSLTATEVKVRDAVNDFSFALFGTVSNAKNCRTPSCHRSARRSRLA